MAADLRSGVRAIRSPHMLLVLVRVGGLGFLIWGVLSELRPGLSGAQLASVVIGLVVVSLAWLLVWAPESAAMTPLRMASMVVVAVGGGVLALAAPIAVAYIGTAALSAWLYGPARSSWTVTILGVATRPLPSLPTGSRSTSCWVGRERRLPGWLWAWAAAGPWSG